MAASIRSLAFAALALVVIAGRADAQTASMPIPAMPASLEPYLHGVPSGAPTATPLPLSLADAVTRGLAHNLGALLQADRVQSAAGERWKALSEALPRVSAKVSDTREEVDLAAFGFTGIPGLVLPTVVGPFNVFDARVAASAPLLDLEALGDVRRERANERAETHSYRNARELVILAVANLYEQALADQSRVEAVHAEAEMAGTLVTLAQDQRSAGVVAGIDVVRQQVELERARQRVIAAENEFEKQKLRLARAIGVPLGQVIDLTDHMAFTPAAPLTAEAAMAAAYAQREDLKTAEERVNAALADHQAAHGALLPTLRFDVDYGMIGPSPSTARSTYTAAAILRVPIFEGGAAHGKLLQVDADVRERQAERDDLKAGIAFDVQSALLDLHASEAAVAVAKSASALAGQQLTQARDRFAAGVTSSIELAQAQDAVATASDNYITTLYMHLMARAELAHALGMSEEQFAGYLGGRQ